VFAWDFDGMRLRGIHWGIARANGFIALHCITLAWLLDGRDGALALAFFFALEKRWIDK